MNGKIKADNWFNDMMQNMNTAQKNITLKEAESILHQMAQYEGRFAFFKNHGAYSYRRLTKCADNTELIATIHLARENYNSLRSQLALDIVSDWTIAPQITASHILYSHAFDKEKN